MFQCFGLKVCTIHRIAPKTEAGIFQNTPAPGGRTLRFRPPLNPIIIFLFFVVVVLRFGRGGAESGGEHFCRPAFHALFSYARLFILI